ncbi:acyl-CoA N-acyltransferase [Lipomyces chichibuensis]|uniref:acyl-CoA N-acyltransferase n=1 Tax=Lipomyces chichibuensis TaxID=1546026 RepID=UPI003343397F
MAYLNNGLSDSQAAPVVFEYHRETPFEQYDLNFVFTVKEHESESVRLVPFIPSIHANIYFRSISAQDQLFRYLPYGPFHDLASFLTWLEIRIRSDKASVLYAVVDKTCREQRLFVEDPRGAHPPGALAGVIGLIDTDATNLSSEVGHICMFPAFQRTHVTTQAAGLLLQWALESPRVGGLGLRRVAWKAHLSNSASVRAATRLGFKMEGTVRWQRVLSETKDGLVVDNAKLAALLPGKGRGRHTYLLGICWDDWEDAGRTLVNKLMARKV